MKRQTWILAGVAGAAWLAALFLPVWPRYALERDFRAVLRRAGELDVPRSLAELEAKYPMPPDDANAAPLYARARSIMARHGEESALRMPGDSLGDGAVRRIARDALGHTWPADNLVLIRDAVAENAEAIALMESARALPHSRLSGEFDDAVTTYARGTVLPTPDQTFLMALAAVDAFENGDHDGAVRAIETLAATIRHRAGNPGVEVLLYAPDAVGLAAPIAMWVANRDGLSEDHLTRLETAMRSLGEPALWRPAPETAFLGAIDSVRRDIPYYEDGSVSFADRVRRGVLASNSAAARRAQSGDIATLHWLLDQAAAVDAHAPGADEPPAHRLTHVPGINSRSAMFASQHWDTYLSGIAWAAMAEAVCWIRRARLEGGLPSDWMRRLPLDPYSGEPIGAEIGGDGVITLRIDADGYTMTATALP